MTHPRSNDGSPQVIPASLAGLVERPRYAHLATVPQVNPTWFRFDGEYVWLTATSKRQNSPLRRLADYR